MGREDDSGEAARTRRANQDASVAARRSASGRRGALSEAEHRRREVHEMPGTAGPQLSVLLHKAPGRGP